MNQNQLTQYIGSISVIILMTLCLVSCTTPKSSTTNPSKIKTMQGNHELDKDRDDNEPNHIPEKNNHILEDNSRITNSYQMANTATLIHMDSDTQLVSSYNKKDNEIEFISEIYGSEKNAIHKLPITEKENVFCINNKIIGINSNEGVRLNTYRTDLDHFYSSQLLINVDFTKAKGKNIFSFDNDFYELSGEFVRIQLNFIEYVKENSSYLTSFNKTNNITHTMPLEGDILDIKKLANKDFVVVIKLNDKIRFKIIDNECHIKWTTDYNLEEGMAYK